VKPERLVTSSRSEFRPFLTFLLDQQSRYVEKHGKKRPDVPIMMIGNVLKPYFELSEHKGFDLVDPASSEGREIRKKIVDALADAYGKTDSTCARPFFRSLSHGSTLLDRVDSIRMTELVSIVGHNLGSLGDADLEETLTMRIEKLIPFVYRAVCATLPNLSQDDSERWARMDKLQSAFTDWTMAIVYATAYAATVDDNKAFTQFAQLARIQLRAFVTGIDPYTNGQVVIAYTR